MSAGERLKKLGYTLKVAFVATLLALLLVFVWQNMRQQVTISLVFKKLSIALPWVVLGSAAIGAVLTYVGVLLRRSRRKKPG